MSRKVIAGGAALAALTAGLGTSACGGTAPPGQAPAPTATAATPSATGPTATPPATAGASGSIAGIPFYRPSSIVSQAAGSAVLTSPDPAGKVTAYYVRVADSGGWTTVSKSITAASGNLTIKKSGQGVTISVSAAGQGSVISLSSYPSG